MSIFSFGAIVGLPCFVLRTLKRMPNKFPFREGPAAFEAHVLRTPFAAHNLWQLFQSFFYYIDFKRKVLFSFVVFVLSLIFIHRAPTGEKTNSSHRNGTEQSEMRWASAFTFRQTFIFLFLSCPIHSAHTLLLILWWWLFNWLFISSNNIA